MKITPKNGALVQTDEGPGTVVDVNLLTGVLKVSLQSRPDAAPKVCKRNEVKIIKDSSIRVNKSELKELGNLEKE